MTSPTKRAIRMLRQKHFSPYKTFVDRETRTAVILNPKVGTKSFRHVLSEALRSVRGQDDASNGRYRLFRRAREHPFASIGDYMHALGHREEYQFYCFVRNPYARFKSAWTGKFAFGHETHYPPSIEGKRLAELRAFAAENGLPGAEEKSAIAFETFIAYAESGQTGVRNHHWDEQYSVLLMDMIEYERWFNIEGEFREGMEHILERLGMLNDEIREIVDTPVTMKRKPTPNEYNDDLAARVHAMYQRDFEVFGYEVDSWEGL